MKSSKRSVGRPKQDVTLTKKQEIRCLEKEKAAWKQAASYLDISTSEYLRALANRDSKKVMKQHEKDTDNCSATE